MTITVTAHPETSPPSNVIDVSVDMGSVMSEVAVWRNDHNGRTLLRTQPSAGFDSRSVTDYECPYEENVTYDWIATYTDPDDYTTVWDETWESLDAWTVGGGSWAVSDGEVHNTTWPAYLRREFAAGKYRVMVAGMSDTVTWASRILLRDFPNSQWLIQANMDDTLRVQAPGLSPAMTTIKASDPFIIDLNTASVTVSGTGGRFTIPIDTQINRIELQSAGVSSATFTVGGITLLSYPAPDTITETSDPVTLTPDEAWLIHPGVSGLSVPLAEDDFDQAGIVDIAPVENPSNATVHKILGSSTPIPTTTGPRTTDRTTMTVATVTTDEATSLRALLAPDVPILIQFPPSWGLDFNSGFYQVGDSSVTRHGPVVSPRRVFTLPMQKVQSPVVDVENTGWSYASVASEFTTYASMLTTFSTYADLASNTRTA